MAFAQLYKNYLGRSKTPPIGLQLCSNSSLDSVILSQDPGLTAPNRGYLDTMNGTQHEAHMHFDQLGETYDIFGRSPLRQFMEYPTTFAALSDISGLSVPDYGCGSGVYTRILKR